MDVSKNGGTPKSSILIGFSIINHPFWGTTILGNPQIFSQFFLTRQLGKIRSNFDDCAYLFQMGGVKTSN